MNRKMEQTFASITKVVSAMVDRVSGADLLRGVEESRAQASQEAKDRILALRAAFTSMRERQQQVIDNASKLREQLRA
jgi:hypothetical protein